MRIYIPNSAFLGNINHFLAGFDPSEEGKLEITANEKWIFVHPAILSMIAAIGEPIDPRNITCVPLVARSGHYLERMGLFRFLGIDSGMEIEEHESAGRFVPLSKIETSDNLTRFLTEMIPLLHLEPQHVEAIQYIISELVRNVLEHAQTTGGAIICAQYFKKSNTIRIGIADAGIGLKSSIGRSYSVSDDLDAIKLALWPGVTGTTNKPGGSEQNAGAGLFFIKSIAYVNSDPFMIYSGSSMYKLLKRPATKKPILAANPFSDRHSKEINLPHWKGVVVGIDMSLDKTQGFTSLLSIIRDFYSRTIKERKKEHYRKIKKPIFI